MRAIAIALVLSGCTHAVAEDSACAPATKAYQQQSGASCLINDGGVFRIADGRAAPNLIVCTVDGDVVESWCQP